MDPVEQAKLLLTRRHFFGRSSAGLGAAALTTLLAGKAEAAGGLPGLPHVFHRLAKPPSFICFSTVRRRNWTCSITSPASNRDEARSCRIRFAKGKGSPA